MNKRAFKSLSVKLPMLFVASVVIIMMVEIPLVYSRFHRRMVDQYTRMARGVTQLMVNAFDGDRVEEYIEKNFDLPEYVDTVNYFYTLRDNYPDILYMYVYRFEEDGGHVIIDLDADWWENGEGYAPGYLWSLDEIEEPFASHLSELMEGKEIAGYSEHTRDDGYLFTYTRPIFRSDGSYACTASVDFSMDYLSNMDISFTLELTLILLGIGAIVLLLDILFVRKSITDPINELSNCAGKFAYDTEEDRKNNIELLESVRINTADEIEDVYHMLLSVTRDSFLATTSLTQAKQDIQDRDEQLSEMSIKAYKDMLTGVGNLTAYKQAVKLLNKEIQQGTAEFGLVVFDLNELKHVNDSCGMAVFGAQACSVGKVFKQADNAMYDAKRRFRENVESGAHKAV